MNAAVRCNAHQKLLNQLKPAVRECYQKFGILNVFPGTQFHDAWASALRGETPSEARERAAIIDKLSKVRGTDHV